MRARSSALEFKHNNTINYINTIREFLMQFCNRRGFLTQIVAGSAALVIVGRACAGATAPDAKDRSCANCVYFSRTPGSSSGTCGYQAGRPVPADGGCGNFK
jgi:hypothetical protein